MLYKWDVLRCNGEKEWWEGSTKQWGFSWNGYLVYDVDILQGCMKVTCSWSRTGYVNCRWKVFFSLHSKALQYLARFSCRFQQRAPFIYSDMCIVQAFLVETTESIYFGFAPYPNRPLLINLPCIRTMYSNKLEFELMNLLYGHCSAQYRYQWCILPH